MTIALGIVAYLLAGIVLVTVIHATTCVNPENPMFTWGFAVVVWPVFVATLTIAFLVMWLSGAVMLLGGHLRWLMGKGDR